MNVQRRSLFVWLSRKECELKKGHNPRPTNFHSCFHHISRTSEQHIWTYLKKVVKTANGKLHLAVGRKICLQVPATKRQSLCSERGIQSKRECEAACPPNDAGLGEQKLNRGWSIMPVCERESWLMEAVV